MCGTSQATNTRFKFYENLHKYIESWNEMFLY